MIEPKLIIRDMMLEDLDEIAMLHKHCFPNSIFSTLDNSLVKCFYKQAIEEPDSYAVVLEDINNKRIAGFTIGTKHLGYRNRLLKNHPFICIFGIFKGLFTKVSIWKDIVIRVFKIKKILTETLKEVSDIPPAKGPEALFMPIAIHKDYRGKGNADMLAKYFTEKLFSAGAWRLRGKITVDNIPSQKLFIDRLGWKYKKMNDGWLIVWFDRPDSTLIKK